MASTPHRNRRKGLAAGAVAAALIAAVSIVALESTGALLKAAYTGLGGKLTPSKERTPANSVPVAAPPH